MQKILLLLALLALVLTFSGSTSAFYHRSETEVREQIATKVAERRANIDETLQDLASRSQQLREERRLEIAARQATKRAEIATKVAELKTKVAEHIKGVFATILDRMTAALGRLDKIVDRINSRIAKLSEKGVDTSKSKAALAACADEQAAAEIAINDSKAKVAAIDPAATRVRDAVHQANSAVRVGKRALQNYHKCLVNVVATLKASVPKEATESAE